MLLAVALPSASPIHARGPENAPGILNGVYCTSAVNCWAVGRTLPPAGQQPSNEILHWNGSAWSQAAAPTPAGQNVSPEAVRCTRASDCWAVGFTRLTNNGIVNEALHWNGARWRIVRIPQPAGTSGTSFNELTDVACVAPANCWAVGEYAAGQAFNLNQVLHWNGRKWARVDTPNPGGVGSGHFSGLTGVRCPSAKVCLAVGFDGSPGTAQDNVALRWNGRKWSTVPTASPGGSGAGDFSNLFGLACASSTDCWAFGEYGTLEPTRNFLNEVLHWNGRRWSAVTVPEPGGTSNGANQLLVRGSCHTSTDCWAVGSYVPNGGDTLATFNEAMHWDGHSWSQVPTPDPGGVADNDISELSAVRCESADNCWAVGDEGVDGQSLFNEVLHWNGISWSVG